MIVTLLPGHNGVIDIALQQLVTLEAAGFTDGNFPIRDIDNEHVAHLMEVEPDSWVPIETVSTNQGYAVIDGYHRWEAKAALKAPTIKAYARSYSNETDVIEAAFRANLKHGLPANSTTRTDYAIWLTYTYSLSQRQAAKRAGISHVTVARAIKKLEQADSEDDTDQGGYNTSMIDYTKRLVSALNKFYDNEAALFGSASGTRSENKRAKALIAPYVNGDAETAKEIATRYQSLARSLNEAVSMLTPGRAKTG